MYFGEIDSNVITVGNFNTLSMSVSRIDKKNKETLAFNGILDQTDLTYSNIPPITKYMLCFKQSPG